MAHHTGDFMMSASNTYMAVFLGSKTSPRRTAWDALSESDRRTKQREGIAAWGTWVEKHQASIVDMGGPLGKTKKVTQKGVEDRGNEMGAFTIVRADSHEAAARLFEKHPHFTIFPGDSVEIMPVLPIPGG
jgi:dihydroxyacetone kinase